MKLEDVASAKIKMDAPIEFTELLMSLASKEDKAKVSLFNDERKRLYEENENRLEKILLENDKKNGTFSTKIEKESPPRIVELEDDVEIHEI